MSKQSKRECNDLTSHVVSLEVAQQLKDYLLEGWESKLWWHEVHHLVKNPKKGEGWWTESKGYVLCILDGSRYFSIQEGKWIHPIVSDYNIYPAPILSEVLRILQPVVKFNRCILLTCNLMHYDKCDRLCKPEIKLARYGGNIGYVCENNIFQWNEAYFNDAKNESDNDINDATAAAKLYMWLVDSGFIERGKG